MVASVFSEYLSNAADIVSIASGLVGIVGGLYGLHIFLNRKNDLNRKKD